MTPSRTLPLAIVCGGAIVALALYLSMGGSLALGQSLRGNPVLVRPIDPTDHILGNPAAKVFVVEYADFECTYCKGFSDTLHEIIATEGLSGAVGWVYREYPLTAAHAGALADARAAECVARVAGNDTFWRFADLLYANQPVDPTDYGNLAQKAGVTDTSGFASCYADAANEVDARITADSANAKAIGADGTPYSLILAPGRAPVVLDGAYPYDALKQLVDQALGQSS